MAALSEYPTNGEAIVRGDPLEIVVEIRKDGVPQDVSGWFWRAQIRRSYDGPLVDEFTISTATPPDGTVESLVVLSLDPSQTRLLKTKDVFDLEQLADAATPVPVRTWLIVTKLNVQRDVSHD